MNFCNFAKIIIARTSKDPKSLEWLQSSDKEKTSLPTLSNFSNLTTVSQRYEFYRKVMQRYQKNVHFSKVFLNKLAKIYRVNIDKMATSMGRKVNSLKSFLLNIFFQSVKKT